METLMKNKFAGVAAVAAAGLLALTGCSAPSTNSGGSGNTTTTPSAQSSASPSESSSASSDPSANLVGSGCMDYANMVPEGAGSVTGMAQDPLTVAASNNPLLKTLTAAVSGQLNPKVDLVDTLNGSEFTVFAPVDSAFAKIDAATLETLKTDDAMLSNILTYHVVAGQVAPDKIVGTHKTVQGGEVEVSGSGDNLKVNDSMVICGGVKTANATVYLVDTVLMPPADAMKK